MPSLRIVVIGKNESITLQRVFISVKIACKNYENRFNEFPEIIYIDSNSTDNSVEIAKDNNISTIIINDNPNPAKARNMGLKECQTDYIFFLDGDTEVHPMWLVEGVSFLEQHQEIAGVGGMLKNIFYTANNEQKYIIEDYRNIEKEVEDINDSMGGTFLFRTIILKKINGFNDSLSVSEEFELLLRLVSYNYKVVRIKKPMATHNDYKTQTNLKSYFKRNIFTTNIFIPGYVIVNAPKNIRVIKKIIRRYWLLLIYLPCFIYSVYMLFFSSMMLSLLIFILLILATSYAKNFYFKRTVIALFSSLIFSFGIYTGIIIYSLVNKK